MSEVAPLKSAEGDLAYLRRMADAGRGRPAPFLLLMAVFGGAYGLYSLVIGGLVVVETSGGRSDLLAPIAQSFAPWGFALANLAFLAAAVWTLWQTFGPRRLAVSRAASAIWSAAFVGLIAVIAAVTTSAISPHPMLPPEGIPSVLLILWGVAWWTTAIVGDRRWLLAIAVGSFIAAVALPGLMGSYWALAMLGACLTLLAFLPAVLLMREGRA